MIYRDYGKTGIQLSLFGLGGHQFNKSGIKGYNKVFRADFETQFDKNDPDTQNRERIMDRALNLGVNFFDLTVDVEKEAVGYLLKKFKPKNEVYIQTRPEKMCWEYDPGNLKMLDYNTIKSETERILKLLQRETIDIYNLGIMRESVDENPEFLPKLSDNILRLKREGLIRFASADSFSGVSFLKQLIGAGCFDSVFINYNWREPFMISEVVPYALKNEVAVIGRETLMKGFLFGYAEEAGYKDKGFVARLALKWLFSDPFIATGCIGVADVDQMEENIKMVENAQLTEDEKQAIQKICETEGFKKDLAQRFVDYNK